jgi:hypothetical protein
MLLRLPQQNRTLPMTSNDFRRLALSFPETSEHSHMDHPDFRVAGRIFATLGYPEDGWSMVKLTPIEQGMFMRAQPGVFEPCASAWGRRGATSVRLKAARKHTVRRALLAAWLLVAPKALASLFKSDR